ncbi:MAG: DMT family transporter [Pseudomonadales bacterium]|nr:DMT family transporter [Pseudomonadales bacterium]
MGLTLSTSVRALALTTIAMVAFAANSVLCRLALGGELIDAGSFTTLRLVSGAVILAAVLALRSTPIEIRKADPRAAMSLFAYAICFSYAYIDLTTATGALILFGCVQLTMVGKSIADGERPGALTWLGIAVAIAGLIILLLPGVEAPPLTAAVLMALAGVAWGFYSIKGKTVDAPVPATARNFILSVPLTLIVSLTLLPTIYLSWEGAILAILSGALTSGLGYVVWYAALPFLTQTAAATVQLSVPVIAALGGVALVAEPLSTRLVIASILTLGGIAMVIRATAVK